MSRAAGWLGAAAVGFIAAAVLMTWGEKSLQPGRDRPPEDAFPRYPRQHEFERAERRLVLPPVMPRVDAGEEVPSSMARRDPVLQAMSPTAKTNIVLEASVMTGTPVGQLFLDCVLRQGDGAQKFDEWKQKAGFDPTQDVDRVAFSDKTMIVSGSFGDANWSGLLDGGEPRPYGGGAVFPCDGAGPCIATYGDGMLLVADSAAELEAALDRVEGGSSLPPPIAPYEAYGEIYGTLSAEHWQELLPPDLPPDVRGAAERIQIHVDARDDVLVVADVQGANQKRLEELGQSLGGAFAAARVKARADGDEELSELLDMARVSPQGGEFRIEAAFPLEYLRRKLCDRERRSEPGPEDEPAVDAADSPVPAEDPGAGP